MLPNTIIKYIRDAVKKTPLKQVEASVLPIINTLVSGKYASGTGVCTKREIKGVSTKDAGTDKTLINFGISDGENVVSCVAHNCNSDYLAGKLTNSKLEAVDVLVRESISNGNPLLISGCYANFNRSRVFIVDKVVKTEDTHKSQLSKKQVDDFVSLCKKEGMNPIEVLLDDDTLWAEFYADEELKLAILLFCLSPFDKGDMIHIGIITNPGEGKNHLVDRVIDPFVRCRMAGTGKLTTFAAMFGAMSSDDLSSIELGLLPKMNHDRIVFSEFQTLNEEVYGELLNVMSDGHYSIQKGKLDVTRHANLNMAFFGNPPKHYDENEHNKREMLQAFGKYTYQIISRLTLIFAKPSLNNDVDAPIKIKRKIRQSMDKEFSTNGNQDVLDDCRLFLREYMKYVSKLLPKVGKIENILEAAFSAIESMPQFKEAFAMRGPTDYRKWQEFINLVRGFARLNGRDYVEETDLMAAMDLFQKSLITMTKTFPIKALNKGVDYKQMELHKKILKKFDDGNSHGSGNINEINKYAKSLKLSTQWNELQKITLDDGSKLIETIGDTFFIKNVEWDTFLEGGA
jgi:DNA replicative helicase MCM subunit Mcm2 (Cdc46/Mcm family)